MPCVLKGKGERKRSAEGVGKGRERKSLGLVVVRCFLIDGIPEDSMEFRVSFSPLQAIKLSICFFNLSDLMMGYLP
jgi:hypothetical protein